MSTNECEEKNSIGTRLREERTRLSLSQADLGGIFEVDRKVVRNYEENKTSPRADQLVEFQSAGADIVYILTGRRASWTIKPNLVAYSPSDNVAKFVSGINLTEEDADLLISLAKRMAVEK